MKKIVYMLTTVFYPSIGGVENHIYNLSKSLIKHGYNVKVINPVINLGKDEIYELDGIQIHRVSVGNENDLKKYMSYKKKSDDSLLGYLSGYLRKNYYNRFSDVLYDYIVNDIKKEGSMEFIIHQHDFISSLKLSRKLSKIYKVVFTNHTGEFLFLKKLPLSGLIIKKLTKHFGYIIGPSNELANFHGIRNEYTFMFLSNGVDIEKFRPVSNDEMNLYRRKNGLPLDKKIVFCPRRWAPTKGIIYLIKAIDILVNDYKHDDLIFVFAGNEYFDYPEYVEEIRKIIKNKNIGSYIRLLGNIKYNCMSEYVQLSDMVVIPSLMEAVSLAALEAMACGKIVIGTNVGGFPQIIKNKHNGFLTEPQNSIELSRIIDAIANNYEKYNYIGINARKSIDTEYSWDCIASETISIYEKFINEADEDK